MQQVKISDTLIEKLEKKNFKKELIRAYQIHLDISKDKQITIQGVLGDVSEVKCILDLEINKMNMDSAAETNLTNKQPVGKAVPASTSSSSSSSSNAKTQPIVETDDEIIWINDSYEIFQEEAPQKTVKLRRSDEINNSFKKLNVHGIDATCNLNKNNKDSNKLDAPTTSKQTWVMQKK